MTTTNKPFLETLPSESFDPEQLSKDIYSIIDILMMTDEDFVDMCSHFFNKDLTPFEDQRLTIGDDKFSASFTPNPYGEYPRALKFVGIWAVQDNGQIDMSGNNGLYGRLIDKEGLSVKLPILIYDTEQSPIGSTFSPIGEFDGQEHFMFVKDRLSENPDPNALFLNLATPEGRTMLATLLLELYKTKTWFNSKGDNFNSLSDEYARRFTMLRNPHGILPENAVEDLAAFLSDPQSTNS